jgi:hypothetical protein
MVSVAARIVPSFEKTLERRWLICSGDLLRASSEVT